MDIDLLCEMLRLWAYRYDTENGDVCIKIYQNGSVELSDGSANVVAEANSVEELMEICPPCIHPNESVKEATLWGKSQGYKICNLCGAAIHDN